MFCLFACDRLPAFECRVFVFQNTFYKENINNFFGNEFFTVKIKNKGKLLKLIADIVYCDLTRWQL